MKICLKCDRKETAKKRKKENAEDANEYDKIGFNPNAYNVKDVYEIYNHMTEADKGCYDTIKGTKYAKSLHRLDDSYSQIVNGSTKDGYSVLVKPMKQPRNKINGESAQTNMLPQ